MAVALGAHLIKTGVVGGEGLAKLNRLIWLWNKIKKPSMARVPFL
jgi:enolase